MRSSGISTRLESILKDGQWHTVGEIENRIIDLVTPERIVRKAKFNSSKSWFESASIFEKMKRGRRGITVYNLCTFRRIHKLESQYTTNGGPRKLLKVRWINR